MSKFNIPQLLVNYPGGSGGEWLAYQFGLHDKYFNEELYIQQEENNRFRLAHSWRSHMLDEGMVQTSIWTEQDYDNSDAWWDNYNQRCSQSQHLNDFVIDLIENGKPRYSIPVHRTHEGWYDSMFSKLFNEYKYVNILVDPQDDSFQQFKSNIIKKIWWQDLSAKYDFDMEILDKRRKNMTRDGYFENFGEPLLSETEMTDMYHKMEQPINYTDMMFLLYWSQSNGDTNGAIEECLRLLGGKWDNDVIDQYYHEMPGQSVHFTSYKKLIVERDYKEYTDICDYLEVKPWTEQKWMNTINPYADYDVQQFISEDDIKERLIQRAYQITGERYED